MSETLEIERAEADYLEFTQALRIPACMAGPGTRDPEPEAAIEVKRQEVLEKFLASRPDLERFREKLAGVCSDQPVFCLSNARWQRLTGKRGTRY